MAKNATLRSGCKVTQSILMAGTEVGPKAVLQRVVLCPGAKVGKDCKVRLGRRAAQPLEVHVVNSVSSTLCTVQICVHTSHFQFLHQSVCIVCVFGFVHVTSAGKLPSERWLLRARRDNRGGHDTALVYRRCRFCGCAISS